MKTYTSNDNITCQAAQYGTDPEAAEHIRQCYMDYENKIAKVPGDMMGTPKNAFFGVKTNAGWQRIEVGDFVVVKNGETLVVPYSVFKLTFSEV
jgi:hypothetical protein